MQHSPLYYTTKFITDNLLGLFLLVLVSPMLLAIACAIKFTSRGDIFFYQYRGGLDRKPFRIVKFRTMVSEAGKDETVPQARQKDERITKLGAYLRRTSLDELPQLFNVLIGDMSLVGPRPHALNHDMQFAERCPEYPLRFRVKPGLTGWAQVNGYRGLINTDDDIRKRTALDNEYIDNWSLYLEIQILVRTLLAPICSRNAH